MPDIALEGCRPQPLMSYLKALGVFRVVAEQADPEARLWWHDIEHEAGERVAVGQFHPAGSGLPNTTSSGREPASTANPWDVVLMLEGSLLFAGGVARRLGDQEALFPFTSPARGVARLGRSLAPSADSDVRGETWLPLWSRPVALSGLRRLLAEGRAQDDRAQARSGRALSRAVATLGVDRGLDAFERVVYAQRFGRNYVAVPADRVAVRASREVEAQRAADWWLDRVRRVSTPSVRDAVARVDRAAYETALGAPGAAERWLLALADARLAVGRQVRLHDPAEGVPPLDALSPRVAHLVDDGSVEYRLACALAAVGRAPGTEPPVPTLRALVEPVGLDRGGRLAWSGGASSARGLHRRPLDLLIAVARAAPPAGASAGARLGDIRAFLAGAVDDARIVRLAVAIAMCRPPASPDRAPSHRVRGLDRSYALAYLSARAGEAARPGGGSLPVRPAPLVVPALAAGAVRRACTLAAMRLRADGLAPHRSLAQVELTHTAARRVAAALAFPLNPADRPALEAAALAPVPEPQGATP